MKKQHTFKENRFDTFKNLIQKDFRFLETKYNFKIESIEVKDDLYISIRYISKSVFVLFYYGVPSYELNFYFGRIGIEDKASNYKLSAGDLLYLDCCKDLKGNYLYSAHSFENLCKGVEKLSFLLKKCGKKILQGDNLEYENILNLQKNDLVNSQYSQKLIDLRKRANGAWKDKKYNDVVKIFTSISLELTTAEKKKLEYSKKQSNR